MKVDLPTPPAETRTAILDAAEQLFAELGVEKASIRQITRAAGVNLAAVNYHFQTKDHLALEVFARLLSPLNAKRLARLDAAEAAAEARGEIAPLEEVLEAFIRPSMEEGVTRDHREQGFICLVSRCFQEPNPDLQGFIHQQFSDLIQRFDAAILRTLPGLEESELSWRMSFFVGSLHHALSYWARFDANPFPKLRAVPPARIDREGFIRRLVAYSAAGFRAVLPC